MHTFNNHNSMFFIFMGEIADIILNTEFTSVDALHLSKVTGHEYFFLSLSQITEKT